MNVEADKSHRNYPDADITWIGSQFWQAFGFLYFARMDYDHKAHSSAILISENPCDQCYQR